MKLTTRILSLLVLAGVIVFSAGCDGETKKKKSEAEQQFDKLVTVWVLESANDGTDRTSDFPGLELTLSGTFSEDGIYNYEFTSGTRPNPSPWADSGTWKFGEDPSSDIIRDPGTLTELDMTYEVGASNLEINFTFPEGEAGFPGGRVESVSGDWTFVFGKK
jgi:hypothetical protein